MRVAIVSPLYESVPPKFYGGTERVVSYLTEELVHAGHEVSLFATADSVTRARLRAAAPRGLRLDPACREPLDWHVAMLHDVVAEASTFDVIHFHTDAIHYPVARAAALTALTTLHGRLDLPEVAQLHRRYGDMPVVAISAAQRASLPGARWLGTVHHGLPADHLRPGAGNGGYCAYLGRISPEKRPDRAIRIARAAGMRLCIAAKVDRPDVAYYESVIEPMLGPEVEFVGEISEREKQDFLGNAAALLFPIDWPEPFGLVMIEAMACGTPVIAYPHGAVPEIVEPGITGWIVETEPQAAAALREAPTFDRAGCRRRFEERFTAARMAADYVALYRRLPALDDLLGTVRSAA